MVNDAVKRPLDARVPSLPSHMRTVPVAKTEWAKWEA